MESNLNISEKINSGVTFPSKILNVFLYLGIVGALFSFLPYVYAKYKGLPVEVFTTIGETMSTIAEVVFISLIAYKLYKDGTTKPSYLYLACYVGIMGLDTIVTLISEDVGLVTSCIVIIVGIGLAIVFLTGASTKKIGIWLLLTFAGLIIMLAIVSEEFEFTNKWAVLGICLIYIYPYGKFLECCQKFLSKEQENQEEIINNE